jgi:hypothetical protein
MTSSLTNLDAKVLNFQLVNPRNEIIRVNPTTLVGLDPMAQFILSLHLGKHSPYPSCSSARSDSSWNFMISPQRILTIECLLDNSYEANMVFLCWNLFTSKTTSLCLLPILQVTGLLELLFENFEESIPSELPPQLESSRILLYALLMAILQIHPSI